MKNKNFLKKLTAGILGFVMTLGVGAAGYAGAASETKAEDKFEYTVNFANNASGATGLTTSTKATTFIKSDSQVYFTSSPITSVVNNNYYGDTKTCIRLGKSGNSGGITLSLSTSGQKKISKIVVSCYCTGSKNTGATISINGCAGDIAVPSSYGDVTCTLNASSNVTSLAFTSTKSVYVQSFSVYSSNETKTLSSIAVETEPTKTTYDEGEYFNPNGLVITKTYSDLTTEDLAYAGHTSDFTFSPSTSTSLTTSNTYVTITVGGKSVNQPITVNVVPKYKVSYSLGDGTGSFDDVLVPIANSYTIPSSSGITCPSGKQFKNWIGSNGQTYADDSIIPANTFAKDYVLTLTAVYEDKTYTDTYHLNGKNWFIRTNVGVYLGPLSTTGGKGPAVGLSEAQAFKFVLIDDDTFNLVVPSGTYKDYYLYATTATGGDTKLSYSSTSDTWNVVTDGTDILLQNYGHYLASYNNGDFRMYANKSNDYKITFESAVSHNLTVSFTDTLSYVGDSTTVNATCSESDAAGLTFTSSDDSVLSVSGTTVTAVGVGSATISATSSCGGTGTSESVTISSKPVKSISINTEPTKKTYNVGENFDPTGLVIDVTYEDNTTSQISYADHSSDFNFNPSLTKSLTADDENVTITYSEKTCNQSITVVYLSSIAVKTPPNQVNYIVGEKFDPTGLEITAIYSNEDTEDITYLGHESEFSFSPTLDTPFTTTNNKVTITYGGKTCDQSISILTVSSIDIKTASTKTIYGIGEKFNPSGLVLSVTYSNESTGDVAYSSSNSSLFSFSPDLNTSLSTTNKNVVITYGGQTCNQSISVVNLVEDVITADNLAATGDSYTAFSDVRCPSGSDAYYSGSSSKKNGDIGMRVSNSNTGIVSTVSGGKLSYIEIDITSNNNIEVYGKNTKYSSAAELFAESTRGTLLGTISKSAKTISVTGDYEFIGIKSGSGTAYASSVKIGWISVPFGTTQSIKVANAGTTQFAVGEFYSLDNVVINKVDEDNNEKKIDSTLLTFSINETHQFTSDEIGNYQVEVTYTENSNNFTTHINIQVTSSARHVLIESNQSDWSGKYLITSEPVIDDATKYVFLNSSILGENLDSPNNYKEFTPNNKVVNAGLFYDVEIKKIQNTSDYSIKLNSGKYIGAASSNGIKISDTPIANQLAYQSDGSVLITSNSLTLCFNRSTSSNRFRYFTNLEFDDKHIDSFKLKLYKYEYEESEELIEYVNVINTFIDIENPSVDDWNDIKEAYFDNLIKGEDLEYIKNTTASNDESASDASKAMYKYDYVVSHYNSSTTTTFTNYLERSITLHEYQINWVDNDETVLKTENLEYGDTPIAPKVENKTVGEVVYTFTGWDSAITAVTGDKTYVAQYSTSAKQYTITFKYAYGDNIQFSDWDSGTSPTCSTTPTKAADANNYYIFIGWSKTTNENEIIYTNDNLPAATANQTYYAKFKPVSKSNYVDITEGTTELTAKHVSISGLGTNNTISAGNSVIFTAEDGYRFNLTVLNFIIETKGSYTIYKSNDCVTWTAASETSKPITRSRSSGGDELYKYLKVECTDDATLRGIDCKTELPLMDMEAEMYAKYNWTEYSEDNIGIELTKTSIKFTFSFDPERMEAYEELGYHYAFVYKYGSEGYDFDTLYLEGSQKAVTSFSYDYEASVTISLANTADTYKWDRLYSVAFVVLDSNNQLVDHSEVMSATFEEVYAIYCAEGPHGLEYEAQFLAAIQAEIDAHTQGGK